MNDILYCELCRRKLPPDENHAVQGRLLCDVCLEDHTVICSRCGDRIMADDNAGDGSTPLCEPCYERFYTRCDDCGRVIDLDHSYYHDDDDEPLCWRCYESRQIRDSVIEDYSYKPEPIFHGKGPRYFGLELEIDSGGDNGHHASLILD